MNKSILIFFGVFVLSIAPIFGQLHWAPVGATWYYTDYIVGMGPNPIEYLTIEVIDDSIAGDITLSKLEIIRHHSNGNHSEGYEYTYAKDSIVYYWKNDTSYVMYDFTKEIGETHDIYGKTRYYNACDTTNIGSVVIDSIGIETINGKSAYYYYSSKTDTSTWHYYGMINSIYGNINFLFAEEIFCDVFGFNLFAGPLRCYEDNRVGLIMLSEYECDTIIINGIQDGRSIDPLAKIYPNPVQTEFILEIPSELITSDRIMVRIIGSQVKILIEKLVSDPCTTIDVSFLSTGSYYVNVHSMDTGTITGANVLILR